MFKLCKKATKKEDSDEFDHINTWIIDLEFWIWYSARNYGIQWIQRCNIIFKDHFKQRVHDTIRISPSKDEQGKFLVASASCVFWFFGVAVGIGLKYDLNFVHTSSLVVQLVHVLYGQYIVNSCRNHFKAIKKIICFCSREKTFNPLSIELVRTDICIYVVVLSENETHFWNCNNTKLVLTPVTLVVTIGRKWNAHS